MENKTLTAFTPVRYEGSYPPYFNVSLRDDEVVITVREPVEDGATRMGAATSIRMTLTQFLLCLAEIQAELRPFGMIAAALASEGNSQDA